MGGIVKISKSKAKDKQIAKKRKKNPKQQQQYPQNTENPKPNQNKKTLNRLYRTGNNHVGSKINQSFTN